MNLRRFVILSFAAMLLGLAATAAVVRAAAGWPGKPAAPDAGALVGFDYDEPTGRERILHIDPLSSGLDALGEMNLEWAGVNQFAIDPVSQVAYLGGHAPGEAAWRLYRVDLVNGGVVSYTLMDTGLISYGFAFYQNGSLLAYDYDYDPGVDTEDPVGRILLLDPEIGVTSTLATMNLSWFGADMFAVDPDAHMAYLSGRMGNEDFWRLYRANLDTGKVNSSMVLDTGEGGFGFTNYKNGQLLAYTYEGGQELIVSLDPTTGVTTTLATLPLDFIGAGQFAVDAVNDIAYIGAQAPGESDWRVYVVDLSDGSVSSNTVVDRGEGGFGFRFLRYLAVQRTFFPVMIR